MKNKKLVLSVLSTAVVSSMSVSAFAAEQGFYIGGDVKHFYTIDAFFSPTNATQIEEEAETAGLDKVVYVDEDGKAATLDSLFEDGDGALTDDLDAVFGDEIDDEYTSVDEEGEEGEVVVPEPGEPGEVDKVEITFEDEGADAVLHLGDDEDNFVYLVGTAKDSEGNEVDAEITWASEDDEIATVDETGAVDAVGVGTVKIQALVGDEVKGEIEITVKDGVAGPAPASVTVVDNTHVTVAFDKALESTDKADFAIEGLTVSDAVLSADKKSVTLTTSAQEAKEYSLTYKGKDTGLKFTGAALVEPKIESVKALNLKQVEVKFNTTLDATTAAEGLNYTIAANPVVAATLLEDKQTVVLDLTNPLTVGIDHSLTVANVKSSTGVKLETITKTFQASDSAVPQVTKVVAKGANVVTVYFSEPITAATLEDEANYSVDGVALVDGNVLGGNATATASADGTSVQIQLNAPLIAGEHTLRVTQAGVDLVDYAGYAVPVTEKKFTVDTNTTVPHVTEVTTTGQLVANVKFDKGVVKTTDTKVYWNLSGVVGDSDVANSGVISKVDDTNWKVTFPTAMPVGTVHIFVKDATDFFGNKIAGNTNVPNVNKSTVTVTAETLPQVTSVTAPTDKTIVVNFDKPVQVASAQSKNNYVLKNASGQVVALDNNPALDGTGKKVTITQNSALPGGTYTLTIKDVTDIVGNKLATVDKSVVVTDTTAPGLANPAASASKSKLVINFNEPMAVAGAYSILDRNNYKVNRGNTGFDFFPSGTTFNAMNGNKSVEITLPPGQFFVNGDDVQLGFISGSTIRAVADASGNVLIPGTQIDNINITSAQVSIANASALVVTSPTTLELTLADGDTKLANVTADDFRVSLGNVGYNTAKVVQSAVLDATGKKITFTVSEADKFTPDIQNVYLYTDTNLNNIQTKDVLGLNLLEGAFVSQTKNNIQPVLKSAALIDNQTVRVYFDSKIKAADMTELAKDLILVQGTNVFTGASFASVSTVPGGDSSIVEVKFGAPTLDVAAPVTVKTVAQDLIDTHGANDAMLVANTTGVVTPVAALAVSSIAFGDNAVAGTPSTGDTITITFNRNVDASSIVAGWDGASAKDLTDVVTFTDSTEAITFAGINVGTIATAGLSADAVVDATLTFVDNRTLRITLTETAAVVQSAGTSVLTPNATIKSTAGTAIDANAKAVTTDRF